MEQYDDVCALVPTYNEANTVGDVVDGLRASGVEDVLVVDGDSSDGTAEIAREHGARVVQQSGDGKGQAVQEGVEHTDAEYVLMLDGDDTNPPEQADRMLEPLIGGEADHVIGDRFGDMKDGAMPKLNQAGNRLINRVFARIHGENFRDILSGYRAFTRKSFQRMSLTAEGFGIETEMAVECARRDVPTEVVPTTYRARPDGSESNLDPVSDGGRIVYMLYSLAKTSNPLFYFGLLGFLSGGFGLALAGWVGYEWFGPASTSHEVLAVVAAFGVLFGVQLLMFGVLSDLIVSVHRERMRRLRD